MTIMMRMTTLATITTKTTDVSLPAPEVELCSFRERAQFRFSREHATIKVSG